MKNSTLAIGAVVVLAIIIIFAVGGRSDKIATTSPTSSPVASSSSVASPTTTVSKAVTAKPATTPSSAQNLSYNQALDKYKDTRIQFGQYCNATPSNMVIKSGTSIMLDNRSGDARTVSVDAAKYSLAGYGFKIVYLTTTAASRTVVLDCGSAQNVGTILIQK